MTKNSKEKIINTITTYRYTMALDCVLFSVTANAATGITTLVSVSSDGVSANHISGHPGVSADGRFVTFESDASNLVRGDMNEYSDIFVHDRQTGETILVSAASDGTQGNKFSSKPSISADGYSIVFFSFADNLVAGDTNNASDVFVHDRRTGETTLVHVASDGIQGNAGSYSTRPPSISANGRYVAFASFAVNLVAGDTNERVDTFVHDRVTKETTRVSVSTDGTQQENGSSALESSISADGRFIAFASQANNLVAEDTHERKWRIFVHDRQVGETTLVSVASDGTQAYGYYSDYPSISVDGRFVAFYSNASNLVVGDTNNYGDVFVHDRQIGETTRVSVASDGTQAN